MAQQTADCEEKHSNNVPKNSQDERETESDCNTKTTCEDLPKRTTRSRRSVKPKKEFECSPSLKKQSKEDKPATDGVTDILTKKRALWGCIDKSLFFDALLEHGKDFDAIQNFMIHKQKKRGDPDCNFKSKDQIRHFYYRTWHKISPFIHQSSSDEMKKQTTELLGVLCYAEIRKKVVANFDEKLGRKLNELVHKGSTVLKLKGKKLVLKAPMCKAKKFQHAEPLCPLKALMPKKMNIEVLPKNNKSWSFVQGLSQNPRILVLAQVTHSVASIINFLQLKWSQEKAEGACKTKLRFHLPPNVRLNYDASLESQSKIIRAKSDVQQVPEMNTSENKLGFAKCPNYLTPTQVDPPLETSFLNHKQSDSNEDDDDDNDDGIHMEVDDEDESEKRSKPTNPNDKRCDDKESMRTCEIDELSRKLLNEGLDEMTGVQMTIAKLLVLLGFPEVIRLEYDWMEPTGPQLPGDVGEEGNTRASEGTGDTNTSARPKTPPLKSPFLNSRIRRLVEIACAEYYATYEQKGRDTKPKEAKCSSNVTTSGAEVFRVPDSIPPRMSQTSKNNEKRIMDQDLLQQMPIFQKKPEMFISRRTRKKTVQKPTPLPNLQRPLVPKINNPLGQQEIVVGGSNAPLMGFSSLNDLIMLHAGSSLLSTASSSLTTSMPLISSSSSSSAPLTSLASSSKPSFITMEPSELKPSVRRIIPITLNKTNNPVSAKPPLMTSCQPSTISKVITGTDVFLVDKIFEDSASNDVSANPKATDGKLFGVGSHSIDSGTNDVNKNNEPTLHKQTSMEEQWLHNEELSLTSLLQDVSSNMSSVPASGVNLIQHFFMSESSRDSNLIGKFDVDLQCLMNESSLDYASRFADIAAQLSISSSSSSSGIFQAPSSSSSTLTVNAISTSSQSSLVPSRLIT